MADTAVKENEQGTEEEEIEDEAGDEATPVGLTEEEVNRREAKLRRSYERRLKAAKKEQQDLESRFVALEEALKEKEEKAQEDPAPDPEPQTPEPDPQEAQYLKQLEERFARLEKQTERRLKQAEEEVNKHLQETKRERELRLKAERDRELQDAIAAVGAVDPKGAYRYFIHDVVWDDLEKKYLYKNGEDDLVPIAVGVQENMPSWLRASKVRSGSGAASSASPKPVDDTRKKMENLKQEMEALRRRAFSQQAKDGRALREYEQKKQELLELEKELE